MRPARSRARCQCAACGTALPEGETVSCSQCGATLAITSLADANAEVQALAPALRAAAARPSPEVVKRRLDALGSDLPRRREWIAGMEADAQRARDRGGFASRGDDDFDWGSLLRRGTNPARAVLVAVGLWIAWHLWR